VPSRRSRGRDLFGLLLLDKPRGLSSNQALQRVKRLFGAAKAGHAGSLDPLATGMLPIFFGAATRLATYLLDARKVYVVSGRFGVATETGDAEGRVVEERDRPAPSREELEAVLEGFRGEIEQVPPMYSALKRGGVPLYRLARRGEEVERAPRRVRIDELTLEACDWPEATLRVRCSKGTYVRTLIEDIAAALGTVGHVAALRRVAVEPFENEPMHALADLEACATSGAGALDAKLVPPDAALAGWPVVRVSPEAAARLAQGQAVRAEPGCAAGLVRVYSAEGGFVAIARVEADGRLLPERVFRR
jgi:tRNA pseudouridine55 synthase